ncbi:MAG: T9SS type A sorting domain-containing protein, partial [Cytophagales bacterium]|nr:T9SS type A sorting domain-containing protein [Cytophagales bacterium]
KSLNVANYSNAISSVDSLRKATWGCGSDYLFKVQAVCATSSSNFTADKSFSTDICDPSCGFLPTRWITQDIGEVGIAGAACFSQDTFYLSSTGRDMISNSDEFRFAGYTLNGNGNMTGQVVSIDHTNPLNKTGVIFRETLDSNSRYAMMIITSGNGALFQYRATTNGSTTGYSIPNITAPYWVKVVKKGTLFSGYISSDSLVWQQVGPTVNLGFGATGNYLAGIGLTAHSNTLISNSVLTNITEAQDTVTRVVTTVPLPLVNGSVSYCKGVSATLLTATGSGLKWYTTSVGGVGSLVAPTPTTTTVGVSNYYVSQTISTIEGPRAKIAVTVLALPTVPGVVSPVNYCKNAVSVPLSATGTSLKWYAVSVAGTAWVNTPVPVTSTAGIYSYFVSQTVNTCEGPRATVTVNVNPIPLAPMATSPVTFCQNAPSAPLSATGTSLKWYTVSTSGAFLPNTPVPVTSIPGISTYFVSQTVNACESPRTAVTVKVNQKLTPSFNAIAPICAGDIAPILPLTSTNSIAGLWVPSVVSNTIAGTYLFTPTGNQCANTSTVNIAVNPKPIAQISAAGPTTFCQGNFVLLVANTGTGWTYQWKNGGTIVATTSSISAISGGNYAVFVANATLCTNTSTSILVTVTAPSTWYQDSDGDGLGDANSSTTACDKPTGYVDNAQDQCPLDANKSVPGNCGCGVAENVNCITEIDYTAMAQGWKLYPNPFTNVTTLMKIGATAQISVYNSNGILVYTGKVNSSIEFGQGFEPGIYEVVLYENDKLKTFKVAKE